MNDAKPPTPDDLKNPAGWQAPVLTNDDLLAAAREQLLRVVYLVRLHDAPDWPAVAGDCDALAKRIERRVALSGLTKRSEDVGYE